eukprot:1388112-Pleurochrysis_carterae.AAC.4
MYEYELGHDEHRGQGAIRHAEPRGLLGHWCHVRHAAGRTVTWMVYWQIARIHACVLMMNSTVHGVNSLNIDGDACDAPQQPYSVASRAARSRTRFLVPLRLFWRHGCRCLLCAYAWCRSEEVAQFVLAEQVTGLRPSLDQ